MALHLLQVMEELASKSLDLTATNWLDNFSLARQICTCLDKLEEEGPSQSQRAIISRLSDFVWNKDTAAITVSILTGKEPLDCLRKCLDELHAPSVDYVWRCLLNGLVQQYAGKEAVVVVLGEFAEKVVHKQKQVRWPMGECVLRVWRMYKEGLPPMRLLQWLVTTLADTLSRSLTGQRLICFTDFTDHSSFQFYLFKCSFDCFVTQRTSTGCGALSLQRFGNA